MKRILVIVCCLLAAGVIALTAYGVVQLRATKTELVVHRVSVPAQKTAETPQRFIPEEMEEFVPPDGENFAIGAKLVESGHADIYVGKKAIDGRDTTYWEGDTFPASLTLRFDAAQSISKIALRLPPLRVWASRTQSVLIEKSADGETFETVLPEQQISFDPLKGNAAIITVDSFTTQYLRITFLSNSGASSGQAAEIMIFS